MVREMKNIAVFGATRVVGNCVVERALEKGLGVRVLVTELSQIPKGCREGVDIVTGDVLNVVDVKTTLEGQDAAVVVLDLQSYVGSNNLVSEEWKNIIAVLEALRINVVSLFLPAFQLDMPNTIVSEYRKIQKALDNSSLHWIMGKAYEVNDHPSTGYSVDRSGGSQRGSISKHDLAQFLVDSLSMPEYYQKIVSVYSKPKKQVFQNALNFEL